MYIPRVKLCTNCFRHGHVKSICNSKTRCINCGDISHQSSECPKQPEELTCLNCGEKHIPTDKTCRSTKIQQSIMTMAMRKNLTF